MVLIQVDLPPSSHCHITSNLSLSHPNLKNHPYAENALITEDASSVSLFT